MRSVPRQGPWYTMYEQLNATGLDTLLRQMPHELSGGWASLAENK